MFQSKELTKFTWHCQHRNGFPLPAICSRLVSQGTGVDTISEIIKVNDLNFVRGAMHPIKEFLQYIINLKNYVADLLGETFRVEVFHSIEYLDEWNYMDHKFYICPCGDLKRAQVKNYSICAEITCFDDAEKFPGMQALLDKIYKDIPLEILETYKVFYGRDFPRIPASIFFGGKTYSYFLCKST